MSFVLSPHPFRVWCKTNFRWKLPPFVILALVLLIGVLVIDSELKTSEASGLHSSARGL